jgi:flavin reductase (DIM6/NTAB) family NADH-FMN oxidoreductase RutF
MAEAPAASTGPGPRPSQYPRSVAPDVDRFRQVIGHFASGVAIVTCNGPDGPAGLTTSAVTSLSLDPLLLLVCFDNASRTLQAVRGAGRFAVNVLRADQEDLAHVFASKRVAREKFEAVTHTVAHGVPVLDGALAWLACDLTELIPGGDHTIGIGRVTHMDADPDGQPLIYYKGAYGELTPSPAPAGRGTR